MPVKEAARIAQKIADELQVELVDVELVKGPAIFCAFTSIARTASRWTNWSGFTAGFSRWSRTWRLISWRFRRRGQTAR